MKGARAVSPGGALLRGSRLFAVPKPIVEESTTSAKLGQWKSDSMTKHHPQYQTITSPLSSREKGDWGIKRPFPLKSTMSSSTPLIRIKAVDTVENVTDFESAAGHTLSLEKFQELRVAMTIPALLERAADRQSSHGLKSVFEEDYDMTDVRPGEHDDKRWKFRGPWLANLTEGDFLDYLKHDVRPRRRKFERFLRESIAEEMNTTRNKLAMEEGEEAPPPVELSEITAEQFSDYLRNLRNDRVTLYAMISKFLDLAPLGKPANFFQSIWGESSAPVAENPYGKSGPPPSHPSAGIGYLRTSSIMENHPVYGPQERRAPVLARMLSPKNRNSGAKLGIGGFVANTPPGDNDFNARFHAARDNKSVLSGVSHLDLNTRGGAKAWVETETARVSPTGGITLRVKETKPEAQAVAKEAKGQMQIYHGGSTRRQASNDSHNHNERGPHARRERFGGKGWEESDEADMNIPGGTESYGLGPST